MRRTLYLVRHCQATGQEPDAPLTEIGQQQAIVLADWLSNLSIECLVSSPFVRAYQSAAPLAERLCLTIETDDRLIERVLSPTPLDNWRKRLAETFVDLDLSFEGGESSRAAMVRGVAVINQVIKRSRTSAIIMHGNLLTLILKHFDERIGYAEWEKLQNPDVYRIQFDNGRATIEHMDRGKVETDAS